MRYRHLKRMEEREARIARAARQGHDAGAIARALWAGLDARERSRWTALSSLVEDGGG